MRKIKTCTKCQKKQSLRNFHRNKSCKDGYINQCKTCKNEYHRNWRQVNKERCREYRKKGYRKNRKRILAYGREYYQKNREHYKDWYQKNKKHHSFQMWKINLKRNFGITPEQYRVMYENQGGCCLICKKHQNKLKCRLVVDHNHRTKKICGLLCSKCNAALGFFKHDISRVRRAIKYLKEKHYGDY